MALSFEQALVVAQDLLQRYPQDPAALLEIARLLETPAGARGFLVIFLTGDWSVPNALIEILAQAPAPVPELLVKNLVMSTAMVLTHQRRDDEPAAQGSRETARRTHDLLVQLPHCQPEAQCMNQALTDHAGPYALFLQKWGYDEEQQQVMQAALARIRPPSTVSQNNSAVPTEP
ncbi:hypothetical protein [Candidatus Cyanaurora vandensis]|uniref:hypothetical protein n=1 Tax=Candidatus Cyanaurora vandensis TaxID=2714958 RepID=UPI00257FDD58|nr:hypothetical protein [Candidatus Cyanaurora vandensis]